MQVMAILPQQLHLAVLSFMPLKHSLRHLPTTFHPAALCSRYPSIDIHHSLHLHQIPPGVLFAALGTSAALDNLRDLALTKVTLPHASGSTSCIEALHHLSSLTSLSVVDVGLTAEAAAALATVLPAVPKLQSLDLSENHVTAETADILVPALRRCSTLRSLNMSATYYVPHGGPLGFMAAHAGHAVEPLRLLTSL
eukprot:jgi/Ulvmu1/2133/UM128_0003.1